MGSTYVSGYRAGAFQISSGFAYITFHETCESNVHPQVPHWSAHQMDTLDRLGGRLVEHAHCCDSGMTRGVGGRNIRAEHYIERTEDSLRSATLMTGPLTLEFDKYLTTIPVDLVQPFDELAQRLGANVEPGSAGERTWPEHTRTVNLGNPVHGDLLLQFAREHREALPWRIFRRVPPQGPATPVAPWHAPTLRPDRVAVEAAAAADYLSRYRLVELTFQAEGQSYSDQRTAVIADDGQIISVDPLAWFCSGYMKERNTAAFGASRPTLIAFRKWAKVVELSHPLAALQIESVLAVANPSDYVQSRARELAGGAEPTSPFAVQDRSKAWSLLHLVRDGLTMKLPQLGVTQAATPALF